MIALARQCVRFRELLVSLTRRELNARYRGSVLGKSWLVLQPLAFLGIYYVVFSQLFETKTSVGSPSTFALAMFCGLVPWIGHAETVQRGSNCVLEHGGLIKKFAFPTEILPVYMTLVSLINTMVGFVMVALAVGYFEGHPPRMLWLFPIALVLQGMFTMGIVYLLSAISVYVRDIAQMVPMLMVFWFFMSPIFMFAKATTTPALLQTVLKFNPMTYIISIYREIFIWTPDQLHGLRAVTDENRSSIALPFTEPGNVPWFELEVFAACAFTTLLVGLYVFKKLKPGFADEV